MEYIQSCLDKLLFGDLPLETNTETAKKKFFERCAIGEKE